MSALGLCPGVHDCDDPNYSIRIRIRIRMYVTMRVGHRHLALTSYDRR